VVEDEDEDVLAAVSLLAALSVLADESLVSFFDVSAAPSDLPVLPF
jgi:hypothetical protein